MTRVRRRAPECFPANDAPDGSHKGKIGPAGRRLTNERPAGSRPLSERGRGGASVARGCRTAPAEAVVHTDLDGMLVLPAANADDVGRSGGKGGAAEIVVLVLGLGRP